MAFLADISFRRGLILFLTVVAVLATGTWTMMRLATDYLIDSDARANARNWAQFLSANLADLEQIASGVLPSEASLTFLRSAQKSNQVFRYVIFNRFGHSQVVADRKSVAVVELSEYSAAAAEAAATNRTIVLVSYGTPPDTPEYYAHAYVPVMVDGEVVGAVAAFVDETEKRANLERTFLVAAFSLSALTVLSFGVPAIAWYRRTREKQMADRRIQYLAHHDPLTGLANRARLIERLEGVLALLPSTGGSVAVHFMDIDHFKQINDSLGHDGGDFLLKTIGERLRAVMRVEDIVARFGGDEFVVVQFPVADTKQAEDFANRIVAAVRPSIFFREQEISTSMTVGVALAPADGATAERILKSADLALYSGKLAGRNRICFFRPEMDEEMRKRITLERILRDAVQHDKLEVHYQPVFELAGQRLVGFEALARLPAPDGSYILPTVFIPVAEELRLIDRIGTFVLREACRTATTWPKDLTIAVNLSPVQFESGTIEATVIDALKETGLEPERLELEITETLLLKNDEAILRTLNRIKALGVSIVMDDFGTGYSSLSYLWRFPFDKIKIDHNFMQSFQRSERNVEIVVKTIIALGRELNMRVTVEGVETVEQVNFLYDADAEQVQGFYFGRPVPASQLGAGMLEAFRKAHPELRLVEPHTGAAAASGGT